MSVFIFQRKPYLIRTVSSVKVEESRLLAADLGADSPDLIGVEVEEVQAAVVLVHGVVIVVSPEEVVTHLVPLVEAGGASSAHPDLVTLTPGVSHSGVTPGVGVSHEAWLTRALRMRALCDALRPEAALEDAAWAVWTGEAERGVIHPASNLAISILPHCAQQIWTGGGILREGVIITIYYTYTYTYLS